ncbi:MAG TPA: hypothetical protein VF702_12780 [Allosphingosinicella sp.]
MALSRIALAAALAAAAAPAAAQPDAAPDALAAQREIVRAAVLDDCGDAEGDEIVVCGRRAEEARSRRYRVAPGDYSGPRDSAGGAQLYAMEANDDRCSTVGPNQRCSGGVDVLAVVFGAVRIVQALRARRD